MLFCSEPVKLKPSLQDGQTFHSIDVAQISAIPVRNDGKLITVVRIKHEN